MAETMPSSASAAPADRMRLTAAIESAATPIVNAAAEAPAPTLPDHAITKSSPAADIRLLQLFLNYTGAQLNASGSYDAKTVSAVKLFQIKNRMTQSGVANAATIKRLRVVAGDGTLDSRCLTKGIVLCLDKRQKVTRYVKNGRVLKTINTNIGPEEWDPKYGQYSRTRTGVHHVFEKTYDGFSTMYGYPMPRWMAFDGGEGFHYSAYFHSDGYKDTSMGCATLDDLDAATWLFNHTPMGTKVVVYN